MGQKISIWEERCQVLKHNLDEKKKINHGSKLTKESC